MAWAVGKCAHDVPRTPEMLANACARAQATAGAEPRVVPARMRPSSRRRVHMPLLTSRRRGLAKRTGPQTGGADGGRRRARARDRTERGGADDGVSGARAERSACGAARRRCRRRNRFVWPEDAEITVISRRDHPRRTPAPTRARAARRHAHLRLCGARASHASAGRGAALPLPLGRYDIRRRRRG